MTANTESHDDKTTSPDHTAAEVTNAGASTDHTAAEAHDDHTHGPDCGHEAVKHGDHIDYIHDGHAHREDGDHYDECTTCQCDDCDDPCVLCDCKDCTCPTCEHAA